MDHRPWGQKESDTAKHRHGACMFNSVPGLSTTCQAYSPMLSCDITPISRLFQTPTWGTKSPLVWNQWYVE